MPSRPVQFPLIAAAILVLAVPAGAAAADTGDRLREWTTYDGEIVNAVFVRADSQSVTFDRRDGSQFVTVPIGRLRFEDQAFLAGLLELRNTTRRLDPWPVQATLPETTLQKGDEQRYRSNNFIFTSDADLGSEFASATARVFETTLAAVRALPLDLRANPPGDWERFVCSMTTRDAFDQLTAKVVVTHPGQIRQAFYSPQHRQILVPYDAIGGLAAEGRPAARKDTGFEGLAFEIAHQVLHETAAMLPQWMREGLAEYVALVPYQDAKVSFLDAEAGLKKALEHRFRTDAPAILHPADTLSPERQEFWAVQPEAHLSAMLTTYYLIHLQKGPDGAALDRAIRVLRTIDEKAWSLVNEYNAAVKEFRPVIEKYNAAVDRYAKQVADYRKQVATAGARSPVVVERGEGGRVVVGGADSTQPMPPPQPDIPQILFHKRGDGEIELASFSQGMVVDGILEGRSFDQFARDLVAAYEAIGIKVTVMPPREE